MKFPKQVLIDTLDHGSAYNEQNDQITEKISDEYVESSRWSEFRELIFKDVTTGKFYAVDYSRGLTENQHEYPFDYSPEEVECFEVRQVSVIKQVWQKFPVNAYELTVEPNTNE